MKRIKGLYLIALLTFPLQLIQAQTAYEPMKYTQFRYEGSARSMSMGSAFGALGADQSSLSTNPAGLGIYNKSEITISPSFSKWDVNTTMLNSTREDSYNGFSCNNFSIVLALNPVFEESRWKNFQLAFGRNRLANFNNSINTYGENNAPEGTIVHSYFEYATNNRQNHIQPDELRQTHGFDAYLAYEAELLYDTDANTDGYQWGYDAIYGGVSQHEKKRRSGGLNEFFISMAGNYDNTFFIGATVGIQSLNYKEKITYQEVDIRDSIPIFNSLTKYDELSTRGTGMNLKIGAIYRPCNFFRVGLSYHSPTIFNNINDNFNSQMSSVLNLNTGLETFKSAKSIGEFNYALTTPRRIIGSMALFIKHHGVISFEYEMVDFTKMKYNAATYDFANVNQDIASIYQVQNNFRAGAEWRINTNYYLRGGFGLYQSPYKDKANNAKLTQKTLGAGYKNRIYGFDIAYIHSSWNEISYIYDRAYAPISKNKNRTDYLMATFSFTF